MQAFGRLTGVHLAMALAAAAAGLGVATPAQAAQPSRSAVPTQAQASIDEFYRARGNAPLWFAPNSGLAARRLMDLLATAQADSLNPNRYLTRSLTRAVRAASRGDRRAVARADLMLSQAFVAYASDLRRDPNIGIIYVDPELKPNPPAPRTLLDQAATAPSLATYVHQMGWMNPVYRQLREALVGRMYRSERERRLLAINLLRARALPTGNQRYVVVNPAAQRLYMYENGQAVDYMRVVAGKPSPRFAQTPMMSAYIRFAVLNPYWNSPSDITSQKLAPNVLKYGTKYLRDKGYQVMSDWSDDARVLDPKSVDWKAVVAGRQIRLRQKPGPANSMGRMKFMFPNKQDIWLHDTPLKDVLTEDERLVSAGCVRLEDASRLARWLFGRPVKAEGSKPEQKLALPTLVPLYITYLTAVPSGSSIAYFDDMYGLDAQHASLSGRLASN